jgi:hypothetical protein
VSSSERRKIASRTTIRAAISSAAAAPRVYCAPWKKLTIRLPIITPFAPPTSCGVRYSPRMGMKTKITAVTIPGSTCGSMIRRIAVSGVAPRSIAARSWSQSKRSSAA